MTPEPLETPETPEAANLELEDSGTVEPDEPGEPEAAKGKGLFGGRQGAVQRHEKNAIFGVYDIRLARAKIMADQGKTYNQIVNATGLARHTISLIIKGVKKPLDSALELVRNNEADKLTLMAHRILDGVSDEDIKKAGLSQKVTSAAILFDKRQMLEGKPTAIVDMGSTVEAIQRELLELQAHKAKLQRVVDATVVDNVVEDQIEKLEAKGEGKEMRSLLLTMFMACVTPVVAMAGVSGIARGNGDATSRTTGAVKTIDYAHHEIHAGSHYFIVGSTSLASTQICEFIFITPNTTAWPHMAVQYNSSAAGFTFVGYEAVTVTTTPAVGVTPLNNARNSTNTSGVLIFRSTGTATVSATIVDGPHTVGASGNPVSSVGGTGAREDELILKQNTKYVFRFTNLSTANVINYRLNWYEHTDK